MFSKTALTLLALGTLYVNASTVPIARSPAPEAEFQDLATRVNLEPVKREIIDGLPSRELEDRVQQSKRNHFPLPICPRPLPKNYHKACKFY